MSDNSDSGGVGLLAFILGGVVVLVLAIAAFMFLGNGRMPGGDQVNINVPAPSSGGGSR